MNTNCERLFDKTTVFDDISSLGLCDINLTPEMSIDTDSLKDNSIFRTIESFFVNGGSDSWQLPRLHNARRYCHFEIIDETTIALCICHKEICEENSEIVVVDLLMEFSTNQNAYIDRKLITQFLSDLKEHVDVHFVSITSDDGHSSSMRKWLDDNNIAENVDIISVQSDIDIFYSIAIDIESNGISIGKCERLQDQLKSVRFEKGSFKFLNGHHGLLDAFCGAIYSTF